MAMMFGLALRSMLSRRLSLLLTVLTLALSVALFLTIERLRLSARDSFDGTVSGVDVLVGARGSDLGLLLYTVFQIGDAAPSIRWSSYQALAADKRVAWSVPLSLGDSHRGHRVIATTSAYFDHVRFGKDQPLRFSTESGERIEGFGVVLGAQTARSLGYGLGAPLVVQHGLASAGDDSHAADPFIVTGILQPTGTPLDHSLLVGIRAFEAIHDGWRGSVPGESEVLQAASAGKARLDVDLSGPEFEPSLMTAAYVGLKSKRRIFQFIEDVEDRAQSEPLSAVLPGITLSQLWVLVGSAERALQLFSVLIVVVALAGQVTLLVATLDLRRREIAIYRALGAQPRTIAGLLVVEATLIGATAAIGGLLLTLAGTWLAGQLLGAYLKLDLSAIMLTASQALALAAFIGVSILTGLIPAVMAYRSSLQDGMRARY